MWTQEARLFFLEHGYLHARGVITGDHLAHLRTEFDRVWETEDQPVSMVKLLKHRSFLDLIEHPSILERHRAIFGSQIQLLQADLGRQGSQSRASERSWHRDFVFPGERPLAINTLLFLDTITEEAGPTRVVPGTHRGEALPPMGREHEPLPGEVAVCVEAGDAIFINSAIWHPPRGHPAGATGATGSGAASISITGTGGCAASRSRGRSTCSPGRPSRTRASCACSF